MSKIREQFESPPPTPLEVAPTGDLKPYVIFTQLRKGGPHIYAGWLEASDDAMALNFAKEHYGQDQECVGIWAINRAHLTSSDGLYTAVVPPMAEKTFSHSQECENVAAAGSFGVFTQKRPGDLFLEAGTIDAATPQTAVDTVRMSSRMAQNAHAIWVAATYNILKTSDDELIWRYTDQSYRLARGYGREVRAKWVAFRDERKLAEYEKDDLAEAF